MSAVTTNQARNLKDGTTLYLSLANLIKRGRCVGNEWSVWQRSTAIENQLGSKLVCFLNRQDAIDYMDERVRAALREHCCGDAACFNEDSGVECAAERAA